ncbi:hypothetical protein BT96DRAFT_928414 [Gymnopus androsaceus JB14]|uniref:Methyltransferase domain-containing protein n=1 Tax=Gymnopus androsaceus JB14 TaxID=1447944 RepID=A0A6A4GLG4_9AGAR|nr:hypothetical protein BT96DRAFT_928414 [Gymnopus androsaceus JB14]
MSSFRSFYLPLDEKYYKLDEEEKTFFKKETGIQDDAALKEHMIAVQIKAFALSRLYLRHLPAYEQLLKLGKERKDAILIDLGCCFGTDIRQAVQDGYPVQNTLSLDLHKSLWELGHELFRSTPQSFSMSFIEGDILNTGFLSAVSTKDSPLANTAPFLGSITSLNDLRSHVSAVYTGNFFHLFSETQQGQIARGLAGLLSPDPGSMILGIHGGRPTNGFWAPAGSDLKDILPLTRKLEGGDSFFGMYPENKDPYLPMEWSVTRLYCEEAGL